MTSLRPPAGESTAAPSRPDPGHASAVEAHGIDHIPEHERHGRPRGLFPVWAAANVNYLCLVIGGVLVLLGLDLWQALAVIVVGNLFWIPVGVLAASGPASGTPSEVVMRAMYGVRGNRVNIAVTGWAVCICYIALNLAASTVAAVSLVERLGVEATAAVTAALVIAISAVTLAIGVYGHAMIMRLYRPITVVLTAAIAVVAVSVLPLVDWGHSPAEPLHGARLWAMVLVGVTLVASGPLSYTNSADFARYLPSATPARSVVLWTALGGFVPSVAVIFLGSLAATAVDMSDPQRSLEGILPGWFAPVFPLVIILGTVAINAMTAYSSGLALQAMGVRLRRSLSVLVDGALAVALTLYALLVSDFLDAVGDLLQLTVVLLGPSTAIYATDVLIRRNRYDGPALTDESPGGPFWYTGGVHWAGAFALVCGAAAASLFTDTDPYTGPLAAAWGLDLSLPVGIGVAGVLYALLMRRPA